MTNKFNIGDLVRVLGYTLWSTKEPGGPDHAVYNYIVGHIGEIVNKNQYSYTVKFTHEIPGVARNRWDIREADLEIVYRL